jgi:Holliday junction resolvase RusA-like endonuclease
MTAPKLEKRVFECVLYVKPQPWRRPRFRGNRGFKDEASVAVSAEIRWLVQMQKPVRFDGPVSLGVVFHLAKPKSAPKKRIYPCQRPDIDNYAKLLMDALNGICWTDDSQVVVLAVKKVYGDPERIEFCVGEL